MLSSELILLLLVFTVFHCCRPFELTFDHAASQVVAWRQGFVNSRLNTEQNEVHCTVTVEENGLKLAALVGTKWVGSTKRAKELCKNGLISVNGYKSFGTRILKTADQITLSPGVEVEETNLSAFNETDREKLEKLIKFVNNLLDESRNPPLSVLYEDETMAVVYKPAGVHSLQWLNTMKQNFFCLDHTLPLILSAPTKDCLLRPLPCHRLDMRVSGCLVCAKTTTALSGIARQFQQHTVEKEYSAIVVGDFHPDHIVISDPIDGLEAETEVFVLHRTACNIYGCLTTLKLMPKTGRRHQLRRHCVAAGYPILGDDLYHAAAGWTEKEMRLVHIADIAQKMELRKKGKEEQEEEGEEEDEQGSVAPIEEPEHFNYGDRKKNFKSVRRGVGLFLSSTAVQLRHPSRPDETVQVKCEVPPRFRQVLQKASRGAQWASSQSNDSRISAA